MKERCIHRHSRLTHPACFRKDYWEGKKIGFFDVETSGLNANFDIIYCGSIVDEKGYLRTFRVSPEDIIKKKSYDKKICRDISNYLRNFDVIVTYYGTWFDIPFVRSRCLRWKIPFPEHKSIIHLDLYGITKTRLKLHSYRAEVACAFLEIEGKTKVDPEIWLNAKFGDNNALRKIQKHNIGCVQTLRKMFFKLKPFIANVRKSI